MIGISVITVSSASEDLLKNILLDKDAKSSDIKIKGNEIWVSIEKAPAVLAVIRSMKLQYSQHIKNLVDEAAVEKAFAEKGVAIPQGMSKKAMRRVQRKARASA